MCSHVSAVSEAARVSFVRATGIPNCNTSTIYNGLAVKSANLESPPINLQQMTLGIAGNVTPVKGHEVLLRAIRLVKSRQRPVRLIVIGDGRERPTLQQIAHTLGVEENVEFWGAYEGSEDQKFQDFLSRINALVIPSFSEACPMVALEAMRAAKPIIASRVGGLAEIVQEGVNGYLVPAGNADELASAIMALSASEQKTEQMGILSRQLFIERFTVERMVSQYEHLYAQVLQRHSQTRVGNHPVSNPA